MKDKEGMWHEALKAEQLGAVSPRNAHRPFVNPAVKVATRTTLAIYLNLYTRPMVLHSRPTEVVSVVKFDARPTHVVSWFHVVEAGTSLHTAAFTKASVTNLAANLVRAGRTRNEQRRC